MSSVRLSRTSSSTMGMAIAISAVATTKIRNTSTAPTVVAVCCAKVTRLRMTPLSISSMHISITSTLRRTMTPSSPSANSAMARPSKSCVLSMTPPAADLDDRQGRHHRRHEQHGSELEMQPVFVQERDRELADPEGRVAGRSLGGRQAAPDADDDRAHEQHEARGAWQQQLRIARAVGLAH